MTLVFVNNSYTMPTDPLIAKADLDTASDSLNKSATNFNEVQNQVKDTYAYILERIGFYSAGIISLSITFLGYVIDKYKSIFLGDFLKIHLFFYLYVSWCFLVLSLTLSFANRWFNNSYSYYVSNQDYMEKNKTFKEKWLQLLQSGYPVVFREGEALEGSIIQTQGLVSHWGKLSDEHKTKRDIFLKLKDFSQNVVLICFVLGVSLLTIFVMVSTYHILLVK